MSTTETKNIPAEAEASTEETIQEGNQANHSRSDSRGTQEAHNVSKMSTLEAKVENLRALMTDLNNKMNSVQTAHNIEPMEFPRKDESMLDARTKALKKEWGLN